LSLCAIGGPAGAEDLPGTGGKRRPAVRSRAVALSPTGRSWAAATTDGLLLYSLDPGAMFDPTDLADDVTPQARPLIHPSWDGNRGL
jgi:periodic tryptophan protein 2